VLIENYSNKNTIKLPFQVLILGWVGGGGRLGKFSITVRKKTHYSPLLTKIYVTRSEKMCHFVLAMKI